MDKESVLCVGHQELRDIVIETRQDVKHIRESLDTMTACIHDHDARIRCIEITGSTKAEAAIEKAEKIAIEHARLVNRVIVLEKDSGTDDAVASAKTHFMDWTITKVCMLVGAVIGVIAFFRELF